MTANFEIAEKEAKKRDTKPLYLQRLKMKPNLARISANLKNIKFVAASYRELTSGKALDLESDCKSASVLITEVSTPISTIALGIVTLVNNGLLPIDALTYANLLDCGKNLTATIATAKEAIVENQVPAGADDLDSDSDEME